MKNCVKCSGLTKYVCLKSAKPLCNKSKECSVPADEDSPGWKAGVSVAYCVSCSEVPILKCRSRMRGPNKQPSPLRTANQLISRNARRRNNQRPHNLMAVKENVLL